jgi:threonine dehydratase
LFGASVELKVEALQHTGSFKFRGAINRMAQLTGRELQAGVVAGSSGNHGIAVAEAARAMSTDAVIVLPHDASPVKRAAVEHRGGRVVTFNRMKEDRDSVASRIASADGRVLIDSSNDCEVVAGAGTAALELLNQVAILDALLVPVGGGGLAAGSAMVMKHFVPTAPVYGVEPIGADDTAQSLKLRRPVFIDPPATIADGLRHRSPSAVPFSINQQLLRDVLVVPDQAIILAMRLLRDLVGLFVEPSGACALAALMQHREIFEGKHVGVIVSGGNIEPSSFDDLVDSRLEP